MQIMAKTEVEINSFNKADFMADFLLINSSPIINSLMIAENEILVALLLCFRLIISVARVESKCREAAIISTGVMPRKFVKGAARPIPIIEAAISVIINKELAAIRSRFSTSRGMLDASAGAKNWEIAKIRKLMIKTVEIDSAAKGIISRINDPRKRLENTITNFLFQRSIKTPAVGPNMTAEIPKANMGKLTPKLLWVSRKIRINKT